MSDFKKNTFDERALAILACLLEAGYEAWLVGGAVRDFLMGRPLHDIDITTAAWPDRVISLCEQAGYKTVPTGLQHGTVTVINEGLPVEVTTFRADGPYSDSRRPDAVYFTTDVKEDLARRDFTVNAMLWRPETGCCDPLGGKKDLAAGLIRAVGDPVRRFTEDALRILRAVRFAAQLNFRVEPGTLQAMAGLADRLHFVAKERVTAELCRFVLADQWPLQVGQALWPVLFPDLPATGSAAADPTAGSACSVETSPVVSTCPAVLSSRLAAFYICLTAVFNGGVVDLCRLTDYVEKTVDRDLRLARKDSRDLVDTLHLLTTWLTVPVTDGAESRTIGGTQVDPDVTAEAACAARFAARRLISDIGLTVYDRSLALLAALTEASAIIFKAGFNGQARADRCQALLVVRRQLTAGPQVYRVQDLAVGGAELFELGFVRGPGLGACLDFLLKEVQKEKLDNNKEDLLAAAQKFCRRTF